MSVATVQAALREVSAIAPTKIRKASQVEESIIEAGLSRINTS